MDYTCPKARKRGVGQEMSMYSQCTETHGQHEIPGDQYIDKAINLLSVWWKGHKTFDCNKFKNRNKQTYNGTHIENYNRNKKKGRKKALVQTIHYV